MKSILVLFLILVGNNSNAVDYHIGPLQPLSNIADAPWATLQAGDNVYIHWRATPYNEKWVINRQGTALQPISVIGVSNELGEQPVIDGNGATTPAGLNFWSESRGVIKIGGSNTPNDGMPQYIVIENLEIRSGRPPFQFTNDNGVLESYSNNAASIYVEKAQNLTIRNCTIRDSGNGIFIGAFNGETSNILIEKNHIYDNGIVGRIFEHNTYTAAIDITYQFNHFGPLRAGAGGNNLKDRSAGLVVKHNWIESGNRQLDLVDAEDSLVLVNHPSYSSTFVYGNILIEPDGAGNSQMVHYGGDSGTTADYRKGNLYLYNNTIISTRSGNTTLLRLSTNDETAHVFNNIIYNTADGNNMAMMSGTGVLNLNNNWLKSNWRDCHCSPSGSVIDNGNNIEGTDPLFIDFGNQDFNLANSSSAIDAGSVLMSEVLPEHDLLEEYRVHQDSKLRDQDLVIDLGAFENCPTSQTNGCEIVFRNGFE
ncbi:MAG: right-handed parallel beta-helix repeat-containing protein [Proteobacteria bacterium]|nr:right-handed parallel beta-helix repeat-containing protein [Pseudomonadota bacterium]